MILNDDQKALFQWITAGLCIDEVRLLKGDAGYLLSNMIAKFTLASSNYLLSEAAFKELIKTGLDLEKAYKRSRFYGKQSKFIYEHSIPASIVRNQLLSVEPSEENILKILSFSGSVAMILRTEDELLKNNKLAKTMPTGWNWGDNPLARYQACGINIVETTIKVEGKIKR